jgi:hypothetical protein
MRSQRKPRSRPRSRSRGLTLLEEAIVGSGLGAGLASIIFPIGKTVVPGRPTHSLPLDSVDILLSLIIGLLIAVSGLVISMRVDRGLGLLVMVFGIIALKGYWWSGILAAITLIVIFADSLGRIGVFSPFLSIVFFVTGVFSKDLRIVGSGIAMGQNIVVIIIAVLLAILYFIVPRNTLFSGKYGSLQRGNYLDKNLGLALLLMAYIIAAIGVLVPHLRYGFDKIVSYDTYYNLRFCEAIRRGDYAKALFAWQRPLYGILITWPAALIGCKAWFFDVLVPLIGFMLLATSLWLLVARATSSKYLAGVAAVLGIGYWAPFFLYAGLQTNLLALSAAIALPYLVLETSNVRAALAASVFLGLWHPWTLAYYTVTLILAMRFIVSRKEYKLVLKRTALSLLPGWLSYAAVAYASSKVSVISVARGGILVSKPFLWSISVYFWGTSLRPDIFVPITTYLLSVWILSRRAIPIWVFAPSLLGFLAPLLPNAKLIARFLVDAPFPLLLVLLLSGEKRVYHVVLITQVLIMYLYFVYSLSPTILFPH